jgi:hypothetical protein
MNISPALRSNRSCLALTGVTIAEFKSLVPLFAHAYKEVRIKANPKRVRKFGGGRTGRLKSIEEKLFYALFYLKTYPTFDVASFFVGIDRSNCCRAIRLLFPALETILGRQLVLPQRQIHSVEEFLLLYPEVKDVFLDGTDRRVQRPKDKKRQNKLYSGKRKTTTRKNIIVSDEARRILYLSPTKSGRRHDKKLGDKMGLSHLPPEVAAWVDTGFQGLQKIHSNTQIPKKRSRDRPLSQQDKENNRLISSFRTTVEHAIAGMKRLRSTTDVYRNKRANFDDALNLLAAGIWNYHLAFSG